MGATATLEVTTECDQSCFDLPEWADLLARDRPRNVFGTPGWNRVWWEEFPANKQLFVLSLRRGDEVAAIAPLYRKVDGGIPVFRFVGGIDLTDYCGPICSSDDRADVAGALLEWLAARDDWAEFDAHNMPVPFGFAEFLVERADQMGFDFRIEQEETAAVLLLPGDFEEYLADLDSKERHELRRKRRRLAREHPDATFRTATPETLERDLDVFVDMHRGTEGLKGHFMRPDIASFFRRVARHFMAHPEESATLRLDLLEVDGNAIASTFGFELDGRFYLYNSAYEPAAARVSPGLALVSELVRECIDRGFERFDFLRGPERYKYQLGAESVPLHNVRILRGDA
ncbi:MAG TPA: GNAT family N-acetyltransferase [Actinomycetota bacterium]|nr:GNAT family N-acetyltransferase [Actinomycetota bacterium]